MSKIKATLFLEKNLWVASFERTDQTGYAVAKHLFGPEPSDAQIYEFLLHHYQRLKFGQLQGELTLQIERMNPKRVQREVRREMEKLKKEMKPSTLAQDYLRIELEKGKKEKKTLHRAQKEAHQRLQFELKQQKKKAKLRGH